MRLGEGGQDLFFSFFFFFFFFKKQKNVYKKSAITYITYQQHPPNIAKLKGNTPPPILKYLYNPNDHQTIHQFGPKGNHVYRQSTNAYIHIRQNKYIIYTYNRNKQITWSSKIIPEPASRPTRMNNVHDIKIVVHTPCNQLTKSAQFCGKFKELLKLSGIP
eukprot:TRINITY_DN35856_c0_g1_i3.p4 TRINITY_DN35856_c0_g1~~TRINITY_DN35856_c0_g1_i3.p4  ORF type:complete len:161 (-),score=7.02 TRINITY_DN35856_c0_g1_i3:1158-1640(-)